MIIFGNRAPLLKSTQSKTAACPHCGNHSTLVYSIYSKHAHIFWIPLFPMGRVGVAECRHCKYAMSPGEMYDEGTIYRVNRKQSPNESGNPE